MPKAKKLTQPKSAKTAPYNTSKSASGTPQPDAATKTTASKSTKTGAKPTVPNYLFQCSMVCSRDPVISRMLSVPSNFTFDEFHEVMQVAFGWRNGHMWKFELNRLRSEDDEASGARRQVMMHMPLLYFDSSPGGLGCFVPEEAHKYKDASKWTLADVFGNEEYRGKTKLVYGYDFGDSWIHSINFAGVEDPGLRKGLMGVVKYDIPLCFAGQGHPCAEDCGGAGGWEDLKELFAKPRSRDEDDRRGWYKNGGCMNGDPKGLDPYRWDILKINDVLQKMKKQ